MEKGWENSHLGIKRDIQNIGNRYRYINQTHLTADSSKHFKGFLRFLKWKSLVKVVP